jgi:hypothetical protein
MKTAACSYVDCKLQSLAEALHAICPYVREVHLRREVSADGRRVGYMANGASRDVHRDIKESSRPRMSRVLSFNHRRESTHTSRPFPVLHPHDLQHEAHSIHLSGHGHPALWISRSANGTSRTY